MRRVFALLEFRFHYYDTPPAIHKNNANVARHKQGIGARKSEPGQVANWPCVYMYLPILE